MHTFVFHQSKTGSATSLSRESTSPTLNRAQDAVLDHCMSTISYFTQKLFLQHNSFHTQRLFHYQTENTGLVGKVFPSSAFSPAPGQVPTVRMRHGGRERSAAQSRPRAHAAGTALCRTRRQLDTCSSRTRGRNSCFTARI